MLISDREDDYGVDLNVKRCVYLPFVFGGSGPLLCGVSLSRLSSRPLCGDSWGRIALALSLKSTKISLNENHDFASQILISPSFEPKRRSVCSILKTACISCLEHSQLVLERPPCYDGSGRHSIFFVKF